MPIDDLPFSLSDFLTVIHEGGVGLWSWSPATQEVWLDDLCRRMWAIDDPIVTLDMLWDRIAAEDREAAIAAWENSAIEDGPFAFDFRIAPEGAPMRWISARGIGGRAGQKGDAQLAIFCDVTELREAQGR
ncbi:hypothetical protein AADZ90_000505 [Aestuariibius sp. 2305UL40-4]|uniref:hypothetical protein n=1 Tax=Aestuariibius violaceus TaxID=3234132 RepID=UPI00345E40A0